MLGRVSGLSMKAFNFLALKAFSVRQRLMDSASVAKQTLVASRSLSNFAVSFYKKDRSTMEFEDETYFQLKAFEF